jgi:hypothetical protein
MNKRIEKMIEQCTVQNFSDCTGGFETFDKQKFARLIVLECAVIVGSMEEPHQDIAKLIKQHFGVEE